MEPLGIKFTKPTFSVASSNYYDGDLESLNTMRVSTQTNFGATLSADIGTDIVLKKTENGMQTRTKPAIELKYAQQIGKATLFDQDINFRGYARYRHIGDSNQLRLAAGASVPINNKLSVYADAHYTTKFEQGKDKAGFWVGANYKINNHFSAWAEPYQLNVNTVTGERSHLHNFGITYKF